MISKNKQNSPHKDFQLFIDDKLIKGPYLEYIHLTSEHLIHHSIKIEIKVAITNDGMSMVKYVKDKFHDKKNPSRFSFKSIYIEDIFNVEIEEKNLRLSRLEIDFEDNHISFSLYK